MLDGPLVVTRNTAKQRKQIRGFLRIHGHKKILESLNAFLHTLNPLVSGVH